MSTATLKSVTTQAAVFRLMAGVLALMMLMGPGSGEGARATAHAVERRSVDDADQG
jgi:hypothetical protein